VLRQAPRGVWLEEPVLQHVVARVLPVVRNLTPVVVADDLGSAGAVWRIGIATDATRRVRGGNETVHLSAVDCGKRGLRVMRPPAIAVVRIVERAHAAALTRIGNADARNAVRHRNAVGAGEGAEVRIEGPVLLHDDDDVADFMDRVATLRANGKHRRRGQREENGEDRKLRSQREHLSSGRRGMPS
jgi:hypothetical protein